MDNSAPLQSDEKKNDNNRADRPPANAVVPPARNERKEGEQIAPNCSWFIDQYDIIGADGDTQAVQSFLLGVPLAIHEAGVPREYKDSFEITSLCTYDRDQYEEEGSAGTDGVSMKVLVSADNKWHLLQVAEAANNGDFWLDVLERVIIPQAYNANGRDAEFVATMQSLKDSTDNVCVI